ncbi:YlaI family protein [Ornithinibacillus sp. BX22]|uniref:YlaI family protein n=2 Tax=Ornithinibacillus TaxID=484508 RepID=A0A923L3K0_9BACI|nr:YlaI family protein [Ornithinibacillus hominis]MBS3680178.1 YlaI family protein [Ornithinibacillus massiliensis]
MQVKCVLCDVVENIEDFSLQAKRLRNKKTYMYLCDNCNERIKERTLERLATNKFRLYEEKKKEDELI